MKKNQSISLRGVLGADADFLFPYIHNSPVTDNIVWDGPTTLAEYKDGLNQRETQHLNGEVHFFTIIESANNPIGTITIRPQNEFRADIGLWIGLPFHGKGYGTEAIQLITDYGFDKLKLQKIEALVFVGNLASRKIFEKNGYVLEGTIRSAVKKRGKLLDEWILGLVKS
ncbi:MAG: GNAT family N-acetyltransferase [Bdellovibrio sp.]